MLLGDYASKLLKMNVKEPSRDRTRVMMIPMIIFLLRIYPLRFAMIPKMTEPMGIGVSRKYSQKFSTNRLFIPETRTTRHNPMRIDTKEAINSKMEMVFHAVGIGSSVLAAGRSILYKRV